MTPNNPQQITINQPCATAIAEYLGEIPNSIFWWYYRDIEIHDASRWELRLKEEISESDWELSNTLDILPAYTFSELITAVLPAIAKKKGGYIRDRLWCAETSRDLADKLYCGGMESVSARVIELLGKE